MKFLRVLFFILVSGVGARAQGLLTPAYFGIPAFRTSYTEMYASVSSGFGNTIGINHVKSLSPRTSIVVGASQSSFRMFSGNSETGRNSSSASMANLRAELRYNLTPKDKPLTAFVYAALNNNFNNFGPKPGYNLGLEVGGELRYKVSENVFFFARTSFYRQNVYGTPNMIAPYGTFR